MRGGWVSFSMTKFIIAMIIVTKYNNINTDNTNTNTNTDTVANTRANNNDTLASRYISESISISIDNNYDMTSLYRAFNQGDCYYYNSHYHHYYYYYYYYYHYHYYY